MYETEINRILVFLHFLFIIHNHAKVNNESCRPVQKPILIDHLISAYYVEIKCGLINNSHWL